jgi:hypothetical protein
MACRTSHRARSGFITAILKIQILWNVTPCRLFRQGVWLHTTWISRCFFTLMWPCIVTNFLIIKPTRCTNFSNVFWKWNSTFRTVPLSIIRSYSLYTQQWYMSYRFVDSFRADHDGSPLIYFGNKTLYSDSFSVHHQELFTEHSAIPAMVYVIQVCNSFRAGSIRILLESCLQTCMTYTIAECTVNNTWWWTEELSETCRVSFPK